MAESCISYKFNLQKTANMFSKMDVLPCDLVIPLLGIYQKKIKTLTGKRNLHFHVHCSFIYNMQDMETTYMSTDG